VKSENAHIATCHQLIESQQIKSCYEESLKLSYFCFNLLFAESQQTEINFLCCQSMLIHAFGFLCFSFSLYTALTCIQTHTKALHTFIHSSSIVPTFIHFRNLSTLPTMASSSNPKKRTKRAVVKRAEQIDNSETGYLERWLSWNQESIEDYYREFSRKEIIRPKFIRMEWLKEEKLEEVRDLLKHRKLVKFLKLTGIPTRFGEGISHLHVV